MAVRGATGRQDVGGENQMCCGRETLRLDKGLEMGEIEKLKCK
jgi:hypothetical protein